jgi:ethanolamine ammonia-lyase small subunit
MGAPRTPSSRSIADLRDLTPARVALGRSGASVPTAAWLDFTLDHARARDAVHAVFDAQGLIAALAGPSLGGLSLGGLSLGAVGVASRAADRGDYLRRPDLGRRLDQPSAELLAACGASTGSPLAIVIGDGLSPTAVHAHALRLMRALVARLAAAQIGIGHVVVASGARVALGDQIGEILGASMVLMLIGERPGLSAPDSLGAYLTFAPKVGRTDAERNCVSNIHRAGLSYDEAAFKIAWLVREGLSRRITGVTLKDESAGETLPRIGDKPDSA